MASTAEQPDLVAAMLDPAFFPDRPPRVELRETHISWVFLAGELAFKVKKPLVLPFLDYGSLERRHEMCREEVRLNRRLAPRIYRGVKAIVRRDDRYALAPEDDPGAIEYVVEMRRVDESRSLATLALAGGLEPGHVSAVGLLLARFHASAPRVPAARADGETLAATLAENVSTLRESGAGIVDEDQLDASESFTRAFFTSRREELHARAHDGFVRDCHGDLRAEHVIVPEDGEIYVYDCIEFNPDLRRIDVAADIAFLVMDLARLGAGERAILLTDAYRQADGDPGDDALFAFFAAYRAWVRAKVACLRAHELHDGDPARAEARREAAAAMRLGRRFAWRARGPLVLMLGGVAASGKTTLARQVAEASGWPHLSSDATRRRLAGLSATERGGESLYTPEARLAVYRELGRLARECVQNEGCAVVDATSHLRTEREAFRAGLDDEDAPLMFVECRAPSEILMSRARAREREVARMSDADAAVVERQLAEREPPDEIPGARRAELRTDASPAELLTRLEALLDDRIFLRGKAA